MLSAKMVGNMIELNRPMATTEYSATLPELSMVVTSSATLTSAKIASRRLGEKRASRTGEAADHRHRPVGRHVMRGLLLAEATDVRHRQVVDQEAANRHFGTDVEEDAQHAQQQVALAQRIQVAVVVALVGLLGGVAQRRQAEQEYEQRQQHQRHRQAHVRTLHSLRLGGTVGQLLGGRQRRDVVSALDRVGQDQHAAEDRGDGRAQRVQRLRQGQAAGAGLLRAQQRDIGWRPPAAR